MGEFFMHWVNPTNPANNEKGRPIQVRPELDFGSTYFILSVPITKYDSTTMRLQSPVENETYEMSSRNTLCR
uniref:Uncharacterized protein n=1 Tax=Daucus carota subsp. sativus TaxID=79200 RepID=A0A162AI81_DAUCS